MRALVIIMSGVGSMVGPAAHNEMHTAAAGYIDDDYVSHLH